jgi:hypothetical protein
MMLAGSLRKVIAWIEQASDSATPPTASLSPPLD